MPAQAYKARSSADLLAQDIAVDIGLDGLEYQLEQPVFGPDSGAKTMVDEADGARLPVGGAQIGPRDETPSDSGARGLIGRVKRIAEVLTSLQALFTAGILDPTLNISVVLPSGSPSVPVDIRGYEWIGMFSPISVYPRVIAIKASVDGVSFFPVYGPSGVQILWSVNTSGGNEGVAGFTEARGWSYVTLEDILGIASSTTCTLILRGRS